MIRKVVFDDETNVEFIQAMLHYESSVRRKRIRRFPYGLYYRVKDDELHIIACFDARRDPAALSSRIQ